MQRHVDMHVFENRCRGVDCVTLRYYCLLENLLVHIPFALFSFCGGPINLRASFQWGVKQLGSEHIEAQPTLAHGGLDHQCQFNLIFHFGGFSYSFGRFGARPLRYA